MGWNWLPGHLGFRFAVGIPFFLATRLVKDRRVFSLWLGLC